MATVFIRHRVKHYAKWKKVFDEFAPTRRAGGETSYLVGHVPGKPNNLCLLFQWDTTANAAKFLKSKELKAAMKGAGVIEKPDIFILEEKEKGTT
jgi:quinol monooxygenase YgiN